MQVVLSAGFVAIAEYIRVVQSNSGGSTMVVVSVRVIISAIWGVADKLTARIFQRCEGRGRRNSDRIATLRNGRSAELPSRCYLAHKSFAVVVSGKLIVPGKGEPVWGVPDRRSVVLVRIDVCGIDLRIIH